MVKKQTKLLAFVSTWPQWWGGSLLFWSLKRLNHCTYVIIFLSSIKLNLTKFDQTAWRELWAWRQPNYFLAKFNGYRLVAEENEWSNRRICFFNRLELKWIQASLHSSSRLSPSWPRTYNPPKGFGKVAVIAGLVLLFLMWEWLVIYLCACSLPWGHGCWKQV